LRNSDNSSAAPFSPSLGARPRSSFSLLGRSAVLDPRTNAIRRDLADIRLAESVFAPHYAAPSAMVALRDVMMRAGPQHDAEVIGSLGEGDTFETLELAGGNAWGKAPRLNLVGYVDADALGMA
jgi:hypothetical protein